MQFTTWSCSSPHPSDHHVQGVHKYAYAEIQGYITTPKTELATEHPRSNGVNSVLSLISLQLQVLGTPSDQSRRSQACSISSWEPVRGVLFRGMYLRCSCGCVWLLTIRVRESPVKAMSHNMSVFQVKENAYTDIFYKCCKLRKCSYYSDLHFTENSVLFFFPRWDSTRKKDFDSCRFHVCQRYQPCSYRWVAQKYTCC